jgi:hemerythrin-like domain-containing protein
MKHKSLQVIKDEHSSLASVLKSIRMMIQRGPGDQAEQFFDVLRAMLFYIDEFPECQHHPKESKLLFPLVARSNPQIKEIVERLEGEHQSGQTSVRELQHLLVAWELVGDSRRPLFSETCGRYIDFYLEHMRMEEAIILPAAERTLNADELAKLDAAFETNRDPLSKKQPADPVYSRLFTRIVMHAPSPIGLGHS